MLENKILYLFKNYYKNLKIEELKILDISKREFAFWDFKENKMHRHISFKDEFDLKENLVKQVPRHVYYSISTYEYPSFPNMEMKRIINTNLVFDIDIDHVYTPCKEIHDFWTCRNCGKGEIGYAISCKFCGSPSIEKQSFVCNECLEIAKNEVIKLIEDFLISDFGIEEEKIRIVFSGNRGYHIHVYDEDFSNLDSKARSMIIDYIKGITAKQYLLDFLKKNKFKFKGIASFGFPSRFAEKLLEELLLLKEEDLLKYGINGLKVKDFLEKKDGIILSLQGYYADFNFLKIFGNKSKEIISKVISNISVEIDERVSIDIHRLIRMPNSIHGKTGLKVKPLNYKDLENFNPFKDSIIFKDGYAKIKLKKKLPPIKLKFDDYDFDLKNIEQSKIPFSLALYLTLNEYADIHEFL